MKFTYDNPSLISWFYMYRYLFSIDTEVQEAASDGSLNVHRYLSVFILQSSIRLRTIDKRILVFLICSKSGISW